ncbi:MBL fold metallo-hydrolase [Paenibacillus hexagrammi]|uniref:MBL fold metallo-hydrolase n=1 Tax=Paenibacillus hexagrammi TaxID=2908839 RepID=UPI0021A968CF|nr:MBL fold metallo-hydrolase [Paenibacillus sp. YPD9-1]
MKPTKTGAAFMQEIKDTHPPQGTVAVWLTGQASVILKGSQVTVWIDPFVSDYLELKGGPARAYPAPIVPEDVDQADICLITHEHDDHLDPITVKAIASQNEHAVFVAPPCCEELLWKAGVKRERFVPAITDEWKELGGSESSPSLLRMNSLSLMRAATTDTWVI